MQVPGWVYILETRHPDMVKVGLTRRIVGERIAELNETPGYRGFTPFRCAYVVQVPDPERVEARVKRMLRGRRWKSDLGCSELFRVDVRQARRTVITAILGGKRR